LENHTKTIGKPPEALEKHGKTIGKSFKIKGTP
jgi:hypothetical protein